MRGLLRALLNEFKTCITNRRQCIWLKPVLTSCAVTAVSISGFGEQNLLNSVTNMNKCRVCFYLRMTVF